MLYRGLKSPPKPRYFLIFHNILVFYAEDNYSLFAVGMHIGYWWESQKEGDH
jgi:hypothetical protein